MRSILTTWLAVELAVACFLSAAFCILRHDERAARALWRDDPTPSNRQALDRQRTITRWHHVVLAGALFGGMAVVTVPALILHERRRVAGDGEDRAAVQENL